MDVSDQTLAKISRFSVMTKTTAALVHENERLLLVAVFIY